MLAGCLSTDKQQLQHGITPSNGPAIEPGESLCKYCLSTAIVGAVSRQKKMRKKNKITELSCYLQQPGLHTV
jgi:hypothetical protein